jgi:hypothetical protein
MLFTKDHDMIQTIAPSVPISRSTYGFCQGDLGEIGRSRIPIGSNTPCESQPVGAIIVTHQPSRSRVPRKGLDDLLRKPRGGRISGHRKPEQLPSAVAHDEKCKQALEGHRGTTNRSIAAMASAWLRRNVRQPCDGGPRRRAMHFETVDSARSKPSLSSSRWMRGVPHNGFSLFIAG